MQIQNLGILLSNIPASGQSRNLTIIGQQGASFILQIVNSGGKF